jgi:hypothetical protein
MPVMVKLSGKLAKYQSKASIFGAKFWLHA